jgi:hypothetical protein
MAFGGCGEGADALYQHDITAFGKISSRDDKPLLTETLTDSAGWQWNWHYKCKQLHVARREGQGTPCTSASAPGGHRVR